MKIDLDKIKVKAIPIMQEAGVTHSAIFGSYATGSNTKNSDIDIFID